MNETLKIISSRRSTRAYQAEQIKDEELQAIIDAGIYAPSATNLQPWHFTVVQNKDIMDNGNGYCEAHHIQMLSENGTQDFNNVIILCANHHRMFHYASHNISISKLIDSNNMLMVTASGTAVIVE